MTYSVLDGKDHPSLLPSLLPASHTCGMMPRGSVLTTSLRAAAVPIVYVLPLPVCPYASTCQQFVVRQKGAPVRSKPARLYKRAKE